jgi:hypothetical protein
MTLIATALLLLLFGFAVVFLTVLRVVEATFPLLLLAYGMSLVGLCLGLISIAQDRPFGPRP